MLNNLAFGALMNKISSPEGVQLELIWDRPLWKGCVRFGWTLEVFESFLFSIGSCLGFPIHFRLLYKGRQQPLDFSLAQLTSSPQIRLRVILALSGGAPSGTKTGLLTQRKNFLAGLLLQEGFELAWVSVTLDKFATSLGLKEMTSLTSTVKGPMHIDKVLAALKKQGFTIPDVKTGKASQTAMLANRRKDVALPEPSQYTLVRCAQERRWFELSADHGFWLSVFRVPSDHPIFCHSLVEDGFHHLF